MSKIIVKKDKEQKILNFYPNVYKDEIKDMIGTVKTGDIVDIITSDMKFLARAYVTEGTSAFARVLTTKDEKIDKKFIFERIKNAYEKRKHLLEETNSFRAFYSEADYIPGLIIDKFDKYVSIQFRNSGVEVFRQDVIEAVKKYLKPKGIYERSDVENRVIEGVETKTGIIFGEIPERTIMLDNGVKYNIDIVDGQKTGFFLDQRDSRKFIAKYINNQTRFLDVFSSSGGFSMAALKNGAKEVVAMDKDSHALELCHENYKLNVNTNGVKRYEPTGTYTYYDLWPLSANLGGKAAVEDVEAIYKSQSFYITTNGKKNTTHSALERYMSRHDMSQIPRMLQYNVMETSDESYGEGYAPDGIIRLNITAEQTYNLQQEYVSLIQQGKPYNGESNNCTTFVANGINNSGVGSIKEESITDWRGILVNLNPFHKSFTPNSTYNQLQVSPNSVVVKSADNKTRESYEDAIIDH